MSAWREGDSVFALTQDMVNGIYEVRGPVLRVHDVRRCGGELRHDMASLVHATTLARWRPLAPR